MSLAEVLGTLWRRRWLVVAVVVVATAATYVVSQALPKVYSAKAILSTTSRAEGASSSATTSTDGLVKTFASLIQTRNIATLVTPRIDSPKDPDELLDKMSFDPVPDTRLLLVAAEGSTPAAAADLANIYAKTFVRASHGALDAAASGSVAIAEPAAIPDSPVRPKPVLYAGVMFVLSFLLGGGLSLLRERLDAQLGTEEEVSEALDLLVLGRLPVAPLGRRKSLPREHEEPLLDALRLAWTNLRLTSKLRAPASILITSPAPGDGKSTCAMGLARVAGEQGIRVTLVEGDLRRPAFSHPANDHEVRGGLASLLDRHASFEEIVRPTQRENVFLVSGGEPEANPASILDPVRLRGLFAEILARSDLVIVDGPPVSIGPDATLLAQAVDATLIVLSSRRTRRSAAVAATRQLRRARRPIAGAILNEVRDPHLAYYDYRSGRRSRSLPLALAGDETPD